MNLREMLALAALLLLAACGDDPQRLPERLVLEGTAEAQDGQETVTCRLHWLIQVQGQLERTDDAIVYEVGGGGEVFRSVLAPDGSGRGYFMDITLNGSLLRQTEGGLELVLPTSEAPEPFWREVSIMEARADLPGHGSGEWTCAPLHPPDYTGGHPDLTGRASGEFSIRPE